MVVRAVGSLLDGASFRAVAAEVGSHSATLIGRWSRDARALLKLPPHPPKGGRLPREEQLRQRAVWDRLGPEKQVRLARSILGVPIPLRNAEKPQVDKVTSRPPRVAAKKAAVEDQPALGARGGTSRSKMSTQIVVRVMNGYMEGHSVDEFCHQQGLPYNRAMLSALVTDMIQRLGGYRGRGTQNADPVAVSAWKVLPEPERAKLAELAMFGRTVERES